MKRTILTLSILLLAVFFISCGTTRRANGSKPGVIDIRDTTSLEDSTQYELIVFDPGFDFWYQGRAFTKNQYTNEYLRSWNHLYSQEWNRRYSTGDRLINSYVEYDMLTDYDFEFNFKLFMYFKYFEETNRIKLIPGSGRPL